MKFIDASTYLGDLFGAVALCGRETFWADEWPTPMVAAALGVPVPVAFQMLFQSEQDGILTSDTRVDGQRRERCWYRCYSLTEKAPI